MTLKVNYGYFSGVGGIAGNTKLTAVSMAMLATVIRPF